jgi:phosphinothricin acetyltransferase
MLGAVTGASPVAVTGASPVAVTGDAVLGYACTTPFKAKAAYETSVEISVYVAHDAHGQGVGRALYETLLPRLEAEDLHRAYAGIAQPNDASMRLHQAFGFVEVSRLTEVGRKFDRYWDVHWLERPL